MYMSCDNSKLESCNRHNNDKVHTLCVVEFNVPLDTL